MLSLYVKLYCSCLLAFLEMLKRKIKQEKIVRHVMSQIEELKLKESLDGYIENEVQHIRNHISDNFRYQQPQIMKKGVETAKVCECDCLSLFAPYSDG